MPASSYKPAAPRDSRGNTVFTHTGSFPPLPHQALIDRNRRFKLKYAQLIGEDCMVLVFHTLVFLHYVQQFFSIATASAVHVEQTSAGALLMNNDIVFVFNCGTRTNAKQLSSL